LTLPDGKTLETPTFAEAIQTLRQYATAQRTIAEPRLPDIGLPPVDPAHRSPPFQPEKPQQQIADVGMLLVPSRERARNDRVVTYSAKEGVRVYAVGAAQPAFVNKTALSEGPASSDSAAWIAGSNLLIWNDSEVACLKGDDGRTLWKTSLRALPALELVTNVGGSTDAPKNAAAADAVVELTPEQIAQQQMIQRRLNIQGGGNLIINGQVFRGPQQLQLNPNGQWVPTSTVPSPPVPLPRTGEEAIVDERVLGDRVIFDTNDGRVLTLSLDAGKLLWQVKLADRAPTHLLASEEFVVARFTSAGNASADIAVLDASSGQTLSRQSFAPQNNAPGNVPVNVALSPDGMLVMLTGSQIVGKDLFEPGGPANPTYRVPANDGALRFQNSFNPEHLQIIGERIVVVGSDNAGSFVKMFAVRGGMPMPFNDGTALLHVDPTISGEQFFIRAAGSRIYVGTRKEIRAFDLLRGSSWPGTIDPSTRQTLRDLIIASGHVIAVTVPAGAPGPAGAPAPVAAPIMRRMQISAFSRASDPKGVESGRYDYNYPIASTTSILKWQVVDGGLYYLSGDQTLHFLAGAKNP
jgi:outer membrane protein assembly factor BamB